MIELLEVGTMEVNKTENVIKYTRPTQPHAKIKAVSGIHNFPLFIMFMSVLFWSTVLLIISLLFSY
jgi:hypothetical protein